MYLILHPATQPRARLSVFSFAALGKIGRTARVGFARDSAAVASLLVKLSLLLDAKSCWSWFPGLCAITKAGDESSMVLLPLSQ